MPRTPTPSSGASPTVTPPPAPTPPCRAGGQRLGLARAFARDSRLLVLDDALSSLDTVTEHHITEALLGPAGGSRLVIAHRVTTAARADAVAWLDGGRIRAVGPHAVLWRTAAYRDLFGEGTGAGAPAADEDRAAPPGRDGLRDTGSGTPPHGGG
ncbi:hypothetical protein [Streptomyces scabiei]|uniref:hypothetical protein n=1 Tax=Streptomyces scabiei TaxID=1930 RepID=UPI003A901201